VVETSYLTDDPTLTVSHRIATTIGDYFRDETDFFRSMHSRPSFTITGPRSMMVCLRRNFYAAGQSISRQKNVMGDKSPKSIQKKSSQQQAKASSAAEKKKAAVLSKQAAGKK